MSAVVTIASVPASVALVNMAKGLGLNGKLSALVAVILGVGLNVAAIDGDWGFYTRKALQSYLAKGA